MPQRYADGMTVPGLECSCPEPGSALTRPAHAYQATTSGWPSAEDAVMTIAVTPDSSLDWVFLTGALLGAATAFSATVSLGGWIGFPRGHAARRGPRVAPPTQIR